MIHPTAVIHPKAVIDPTTVIGPYAVVDAGVVIGPNCQLGAHVYLTGQTIVGTGNRFHAACVIGDAPQDVKYRDAPTRLRIGDYNVFREHVTVHRANKLEEDTVIGSHNLFMVNCHIGHNTVVGDHVIIANGALFGGHTVIEDRAFISGNCLIHQFTRVGTLSLMQGGAGVSKNLPPYTIARGNNRISGLNVIGLRRAGFNNEERLELRQAYRLLFCSGMRLQEAVAQARVQFHSPKTQVLVEFVARSQRGVCVHKGAESAPDEE